MANPYHLAKLKEGVKEWNRWIATLGPPGYREVDLVEADLRQADLRYADFRRVLLRGANLREADLRDADLRDADLRGADISGATLDRANLGNAWLLADFTQSVFYDYQRNNVIYSNATRWPEGFRLFGAPDAGRAVSIEDPKSALSISFDPKLSPEQIKTALNALADYFRACGGVGFKIDFELQTVATEELQHAGR